MSAQGRPPLLRLVIVLVATMLGAGNGLPGLVASLAQPETHVCTCAAGGSHAACPICNPELAAHRRSRVSTAEGLPCGEAYAAVAIAGQPGVLPQASVLLPASFTRMPPPSAGLGLVADGFGKPSTPPPRTASV